ncbi:HD domain-containing phosphohydrolase [Chitinimonas koreensis]|uniref:HD domain-containing phosphohydrolase n=1 Tax=Chitinimonas koreensis TaxID=356302 RepID=UPI0003FE885F|nr:HD domain-containing phosphohydrolase [Chitinimonas koreensis]
MFVDDEANILSAMRRLFRGRDFDVVTAGSGREALAYLEANPVDLVVSDMRMPEQTGAELLCIVRQRWPDVMRIILTGYADVNDTMQAINTGEIYRYLLKPWNDDEFVTVVQGALMVKGLRDEKARLEKLVHRQNRELVELNSGLEQKVRERTAELQRTMAQLNSAHESLKKGFVTSIKVFTSLIEMRGGAIAGHSRQVADLARQIARELGLTEMEAQEVMVAGLLHAIGKLGLPDKLIQTPYVQLSAAERAEFEKHPVNAQAALMALEQLQKPAHLIRHHRERYDGKGHPDGLALEQIPLGSRILALANDFFSLQNGTLEERSLGRDDAARAILAQSGKRYDPKVVAAFAKLLGAKPAEPPRAEVAVKSAELKVGMVLARDLSTQGGMLLLARDYALDDRLIEQIHSFERSARQPLPIYIYKTEEPAA